MQEPGPELRNEADCIEQPWARLAVHLRTHGMQLGLDPPPRQFSGGLANLNYLLRLDDREAVLRRPPPGALPPGAYDMGREFRLLTRLAPGFDLAPAAIYLCEDPAVLGVPFHIMEYRRGVAVRSEIPGALRDVPNVGPRLGGLLIDTLIRIHRLDPAALGLDTLGRPENFLERTVAGWSKRAGLAVGNAASASARMLIPELTRWLDRHRVPEGRATLLHNDLKLDNILLDTDLKPLAVLDWDQATRGDGLFDLATTLSYWTQADDPPAIQRLRQMPSARAGFPNREQAAAEYARRAGRDLSDFCFYRVLAIFKLAVIFHQLHAGFRQGTTTDLRYAGFGDLADGILEFAWLVARGDFF
jgi:aminoglycoside phosphotransferase (APT) family kinase protein